MKKVVGFIALILLNAAVYASPTSELMSQFQQMNSMQAHFIQKLTQNQKVVQTSEGEMQIQKPNKLRWQIQTPNEQLILADGKKLWIYDQDLAQVTVKSMQNGLSQTPAALLSGSEEVINQQYTITRENDWFILTPKTKNSEYQWIKLRFENDEMKSMLLKDKLGQMSEIKFSDIKVNPDLDSKLFQFTPPKGVDVIDS